MNSVVSIDPFRCRMWDLHDRLEQHIDEITCKAEIESFEKNGQLIPALGRPLPGRQEHEVELIYGARRLFVAQYLNKPLLVELRDLTDAEAIIAMDIENRHRVDISPYERGRSYVKWLRGGYFKSQDEIARALRVSPSQVCRLIKLATLPSVVVAAFASPIEICETWALDLAAILEDTERRRATCSRARLIAAQYPRPPARDVYRQLLSASIPGQKIRPKAHDEVVTDTHNKPLFRIRHQSNAIAIILPMDKLSAPRLKELRLQITQVLQGAIA